MLVYIHKVSPSSGEPLSQTCNVDVNPQKVERVCITRIRTSAGITYVRGDSADGDKRQVYYRQRQEQPRRRRRTNGDGKAFTEELSLRRRGWIAFFISKKLTDRARISDLIIPSELLLPVYFPSDNSWPQLYPLPLLCT